MKRIMLLAGAMLLGASIASAELSVRNEMPATPEIRPFVGAYIPTGAQRDELKTAVLGGAQFGYEYREMMHFVGTVAWSPGKENVTADHEKVNVYTYDAGIELFMKQDMANGWQMRPFLGLGGGARTYDPATRGIKTKTYPDGYGAIGAEFQLRQIALRIEGRDYISQFKGIAGDEKSVTRNNMMVVAALAWHLR
jgi:hypothetical protein